MEGVTNVITSAVEGATSIFSSAVTMVTGNSIAMVFIGISLLGGGIGLFRRVTRH